VRNLEREIAKLCRKIVRISSNRKTKQPPCHMITQRNLEKFLGVHRYRFGLAEEHNRVGQVTGLAWTESGGDLLTIEVVTVLLLGRKGRCETDRQFS
jgi:ATP-dependent Lon protease